MHLNQTHFTKQLLTTSPIYEVKLGKMGRATKWFRGLFCPKKLDPALLASKLSKEKRRWSFAKSYREKDTGPIKDTAKVPNEYDKSEESQQTTLSDGVVYSNKCAIAVAATSAVMPEAAVATSQADAPVVKLTSTGRSVGNSVAYVSGSCVGVREESAAIRIQTAFRGCLARRALRALKGLVRLQAIVRGHIERKRTPKWLRQMQAMLQAQKIARAMRDQISNSWNLNCKPSQFHQPKSGSKSNFINIGDQDRASSGLGPSDGWLDERSADHGTPNGEHSYRNFEMNTGKSRITPGRRRNLFQSSNYDLSPNKLISQSFTTSKDSTNHHIYPSPLGHCEVQSPSRLKLVHHEVEECSFWTTNNSPQFFCASLRCCDDSRRSPFIPRKSDGSRIFLSGDSDYPSYMACTESSKAKVRSLSAPKMRLQYERSSSAKKCSVGLFESSAPRMCTLHSNFTNKTYPGSGRLDKMGIPISYTY